MRQTVSFLSSMFLTLRRFIVKFARILFTGDNTSYCESLCYHILRYTNVAHAVTRSEAGSLLYMMIKSNIQQRKNFSRTKLQSTIAISRLCGGEHLNNSDDFSSLQKTLDYVAKLANKEYSKIPHFEHIGGEVLQLVQRLFQVIQDSLKIDKYKNDPEMVADLTYQVSLGYKESPDLRLTWIENLVSCHKKSANFEEVAQCKFLIAGLIIESLRSRLESQQTGLPLSKEEIVSFCPNMPTEPGHPSGKDSTDENLFTSVQFSERGLIDVLLQTTDILRACQRFETCVEMFNVLLEYYQTKKDYKNLSVCFDELKEVCVSLVSTDKNEGRLFNNYYRVCFYGQLFEETNGKEMIYKEAATVRVAEFTERLKSNFSHLGPLTVLPNSPADTETLKNDTTKIYIQIIAVNPYFEDEHSRKTEWDRNFNICDFIYETPFTSTGKAHGDLSVQCKRKTIVTTEKKFPYVKKRLLVVSRKEIILQPLQNAIEIIQNRVKALRRELQLSPPNPKTLQIQLQGAVLAQVNAGPIEIAKTFLGPSAQQYIDADPTNGPADITSLGSSLSEFLVVCQFALKLNVGLIEADQIPFQKQCETSFAELQQQINDILKATPGFNQ